MEAPRSCSLPCLLLVLILVSPWCSTSMAASCSFTISNHCSHTIWPGTMAGAGTPQLPTTGFRLDPGQTVQIPAPAGWSGRIWARTGCNFSADGAGAPAGAVACQTGDCGGGHMECGGTGGKPPATLFEVTLGKGTTADDQDYYDVSLVDGYNLPVVAVPRAQQGGGSCNATGCAADLNLSCPKELQVEDGIGGSGTVACQSACEAFGKDKYCCSGAYATPTTCSPTAYSSVFKSACPRAYSYAYDDGSSLFTCNAIDYTIAFCIPPTGGGTQLGAPANGQGNPGNANLAPPAGSNGAGSAYQPPSTGNDGGGSAYQRPPTGNVDPGSVYQPPPTGNNGLGSVYQPPPLAGNNGAGSAYQPLPSGNNPTSNNGLGTELGSAYLPPLTGNNGVRSTYQPWKMPSSASTRYNQLWFLLPAALLFLV
ncbi:thaumatin-like protein 1 isoform X2 [Brachypodium distachyon]|uniref:thaumatin-like protein 1 isoform X2 n=1 Tax=Brachypodium distachyon TaxID=15368 RepID=UPI000234FB56|nr:thaumatin-like protein 1 isoform X2 [Brachypodium distachyon]|eukprot:XP_010235318.1 thaumatin-like protein 1 isoform X2 [Brachypodium distachyon]